MKSKVTDQKRRKDPETVRSNLLDAAGAIILKQGVHNLTLDAVARMAGISKGGLLHHFHTKQILLSATLDQAMEEFSEKIRQHIKTDIHPRGRFTRAYLTVNQGNENDAKSQLFMTLTLAMMTNTVLREQWLAWFEEQLNHHGDEEDETLCQIIRFASDGMWLSNLTQTPKITPQQQAAVFKKLLEMSLEV